MVVPGFGAFLTRYHPAEVNQATNMFRPPSKRVAFNQRINENDGLLAKHIAKVEGVSYERALESIAFSTRSWRRILQSGKKINLYGVGRLFYDAENLLQFSPALDINYNIHSYGLNIFRATAMEREQQIKRSVNRAIENKSNAKAAQKNSEGKGKSKSNNGWIKWAAILGPVFAIALYSYYNPEKVDSAAGYISNVFVEDRDAKANREDSNAEANRVSTESEKSKEEGLYNLKDGPAESQEISDAEKSDYGVEEAPVSSSESEEMNSSTGSAADASRANSESTFSSSSEASATAPPEQPAFQIVVGSFSDKSNANKYITALEARGYEAYLAGTYGEYTRVAVGRHSSRSTALEMLQDIRTQVNYKAWLNEN